MRTAQCRDDLVESLRGENRLQAQFGNAFLAPALADDGRRRVAAEKRARPLAVPRAARVVADAPRARVEDGVAYRVERFVRNEDDELLVHGPSLSLDVLDEAHHLVRGAQADVPIRREKLGHRTPVPKVRLH